MRPPRALASGRLAALLVWPKIKIRLRFFSPAIVRSTRMESWLDMQEVLISRENFWVWRNSMQTVKTKFFEYGEIEIAHLTKADKTLGAAIERIGKIDRVIIPDLFAALIYAIIGQQISLKAARTVWDRVQDRFSEICPQNIASFTVEEIKGCGMTTKKAGYIKSIAEKTTNGEFVFSDLYMMSDDEVIKRLSSLNGIGAWTAEMLLINSMERSDVISWGDIAIRRGICMLYGLDELTKGQFEKYKARYSPYGSVASIYLWKLSYE